MLKVYNKKTYMRIQIIIVLLLSLAHFFCRPTRNISRVVHKNDTAQTTCFNARSKQSLDSLKVIDDILKQIDRNCINFKTFTAKMRIHYTSVIEKDVDFTAFIRIQKDSIIWISLTGKLGIEGFRILVTPAGIQIMDKLHKTIQTLPISNLQYITNLPLDFKALQNILVGNPIFINTNVTLCTEYNSHILISMVGTDFKHTITISKPENRIIQSKLSDVQDGNNVTCNISTIEFEMKNNYWFPTERNITILGKTQTDIALNTKSFSIDEVLTFPFNIPKSYTNKP